MEATTVCASCGAKSEGRPLVCPRCEEDPRVRLRYRLEGELGRGGGGVTWRARREPGGEPVCLKELRWATMGDLDDERRFAREGALLEALDHPAIPKHHGAFAWGEGRTHALYIAQELVVGENLEVERRTRGYALKEMLDAAAELGDVLAYLHGRHPPVVHRDIKPSNIMRRVDGKLMLIDFGAAKVAGLGQSVSVAGTFGYMAPEQMRGEAEPASDVYGLGMTLAVLIAGGTPEDLLDGANRPDIGRIAGVREDVRRLLEEMCALDPGARPSAAEVARRAREMLHGPARAVPRPEPAAPPERRAPASPPNRVAAAVSTVRLIVLLTVVTFIVGLGLFIFTTVNSAIDRTFEMIPASRAPTPTVVTAEPAPIPAPLPAAVPVALEPMVVAVPEPPPETIASKIERCAGGPGGDPAEARHELALAHAQGKGVEASRIETRKYFGKACELGAIEDCESYGHMLLKGDGGRYDWAGALAPLEKACDAGNPDACLSAGAIYAEGKHGAKADRPKALGIFERLCKEGVGAACENTDAMVVNNWGLPASGETRIAALVRLCDGKSGAACLRLGDAYARGSGVTKDTARANETYTRGCDLGNKDACQKMK